MSADIDHASRTHARKSASGMKRRMMCPGSDRLQDGLPDFDSPYALEGTAQHEAVEWCLREDRCADEIIDRTFGAYTMTQEHASAVGTCLDFVARTFTPRKEWEVELETRFDGLSDFHPGWGGTGDLVAYHEPTGSLYAVDWKFGRGVAVEVRDNPQLRTYALGALKRHHNRKVSRIVSVVVQPLAPHPDGPVRMEEISPSELMEWTADAVAALEASDAPDAPLIAGDWCKFCKAAATCPAKNDLVRRAAEAAFADTPVKVAVSAYSHEVLAANLAVVDQVEDWCRAVRETAHHEFEAGRPIPGWKLVASRPRRVWKSEDDAKTFLRDKGVELLDMLSEPEFKSVAQMEKVLKEYGYSPKDAKALLSSHVESKSGGTVLAPEDDSRPAVVPEAERVFGAVEDEDNG